MKQKNRKPPVGACPAKMDEVKSFAVDRCPEVRKRIQIVLDAEPVELLPPVLSQLAQHRKIRSGRPPGIERNLGPADAIQAAVKILDVGF